MAGVALIDGGSRRQVLERLQTVTRAGQSAVLAVVMGTLDSTYRKPGALALWEADGRCTGVLSGGCLEAAWAAAAEVAAGHGHPCWHVFDTRDDADLWFGSGSGCRGQTWVLLWPLSPATHAADLAHWCALSRPQQSRVLHADSAVARPSPCWIVPAADLPLQTYTCRFDPLPWVWMVGAGAEAASLGALLQASGWYVSLSEHRAQWLAARAVPVDQCLRMRPAAAAADLDGVPTVLLVMSHHADTDLEALRWAAQHATPLQIGLLGPPQRRDALLHALTPAEQAALRGRLNAPVGLRLGGHGPMAVALAIMAWLQQIHPQA